MIPIVYRYIESYLLTYLLTLSSSVPRYLVYLGTWFASVPLRLLVCLGLLECLGLLDLLQLLGVLECLGLL